MTIIQHQGDPHDRPTEYATAITTAISNHRDALAALFAARRKHAATLLGVGYRPSSIGRMYKISGQRVAQLTGHRDTDDGGLTLAGAR